MGITMVRGFVRAGGPATIEDVLDHIDRVAKLAGVEHVGLGSDVDLDGRDLHAARKYDLDGINYARKIFDLAEGLVRRKYSSGDIELDSGREFRAGRWRRRGRRRRHSTIRGMRAKVFLLILALLAIAGIALVRYRMGTKPQGIDPHAAEEIEKAKQR